jgi:type VI secretion system protein ImpJ
MLLAPQHFQQSAWRQELLSQYYSLLTSPYGWGVRDLAIDQGLLPTGIFRILRLEAVMPDGAIVTHRPEDEELSASLQSFADQLRVGPITVWLTLPVRTSGAVRGAWPRYHAFESEPLADENTGEGELRIPVLRPRLGLIVGETPPPRYISIPIARVEMRDESFGLADYVPPTLSVPVRSPLGDMCSGLIARLRQKAQFLSDQVRSPSAISDLPLLVENRGRMQALVAGLPLLEGVLKTGTAHPLALYMTLCTVAGQLASLGASMIPPVFQAYDHTELRACFRELIDYAWRMTNEGIPELYRTLSFQYADGVFSLDFDESWLNRRVLLGIRIPSGVTEREMIAWGDEAMIGSERLMPSLRERRIRGVSRRFIEQDHELIPVRGILLFLLQPDRDFVRPGERLLVVNLGERGRASVPLELLLFVRHGD